MITDISVVGGLVKVQEGTNDPHRHEFGNCAFKFNDDNTLSFFAGKTFSIDLADLTISGVAPGTKGAAETALEELFPNANTGTGGTGTDTGSGKVDGLEVVWTGALTFIITAGHGKLNGVKYPLLADAHITLNSADPDDPRIDLIGVQLAANGTELEGMFIEGTPAADPAEPGFDNTSQLRLSIVTIGAGATEPSDVQNLTLYDENLGTGGGEWDVSNTATLNKNNTVHPEHGSKSITVTGMSNGQYVQFTAGDFMNVSTVDKLIIPIWLINSLNNNRNLVVSLMNGNTVVTNTIQATTRGLTRNRTGVYQYIVIDTSLFTYTNTNFNRVRISMTGSGNPAISFVLDNIRFQIGLVQQPIPSVKTIYTSDGTVFSDRIVNGNEKTIAFSNFTSILLREKNSKAQVFISSNQTQFSGSKTTGGDNITASMTASVTNGNASMSAQDNNTGELATVEVTKTGINFSKTLAGDVDVLVKITKKGLKLPEFTKAQRALLGMTTDDKGTLIMQTDNTPGPRYWTGTTWMRFTETEDADPS